MQIGNILNNYTQSLISLLLSTWGERLPHKLLLTSIPKSGSHLMMSLLGGFKQIRSRPIVLMPYKSLYSYDKAFSNPYNISYIWGHIGYNTIIKDIINEYPDYRVLVVLRDPRDIICSFIDHVCHLNPHILKPYLTSLETIEDRIDAVINGVPMNTFNYDRELEKQGVYKMYTGFSDIRTVCQSYLAWKNYPNARFIHFEDMLGLDDRGTRCNKNIFNMDDLIDFLEIEIETHKKNQLIEKAYDKHSPTFNIGKINRFKEVFSRNQIENFNKKYGGLLDELGYSDY